MAEAKKDIKDYEFTAWLEATIQSLYELGDQVESIVVAATLREGSRYNSYYKCDVTNKALVAHDVYTDALFDTIIANIDRIQKALEDYENEGNEEGEAAGDEDPRL